MASVNEQGTVSRLSPLGYQRITVSTSALPLTLPTGVTPANILRILFRVSGTIPVAWRDDGTTVTANDFPLPVDTNFVYEGDPQTIQFIRNGASDATLHVSYYGRA